MPEPLIEDRWYWVHDTEDWFPAIYSPGAAGGWTNGDTWEDFDREVIEWRLIPLPPIP
jgi:hypothetical protein